MRVLPVLRFPHIQIYFFGLKFYPTLPDDYRVPRANAKAIHPNLPQNNQLADFPLINPNPTSGLLIATVSGRVKKIELFDLNGKLLRVIHTNNSVEDQIQIDFGDIPNGIYLIKLSDIEKVVFEKLEIVK